MYQCSDYFRVWFLVWVCICVRGCQCACRVFSSECVCVCVWDVTQAGAAQHSSLFKGLFVLLQLVQLLRTDKQDLVLRAAKNTDLPPHCRNPCGPAQPNIVAQKWTNKRLQIDKLPGMRGSFVQKGWWMNANSNHHQKKCISLFFYSSTDCYKICHLGRFYWISTKFCPNPQSTSFTRNSCSSRMNKKVSMIQSFDSKLIMFIYLK